MHADAWQRRLMPVLAAALALAAAAEAQPYRDPARPVDERVRDLLGRMTLEEKFWQLYMIPGGPPDSAHDYANGVFGVQYRGAADAAADARAHDAMQRYQRERTRLGIPMLNFEEGVHGLMRHGATVFPAAIGLAATWDSALVARVAAAIAGEARGRGVRMVLSPVVNIATDARWGRVEETYGEDPHLSSVMARAYVHEMERRGVVTTPKHFVANVGDGGRDSYPVDASRRLLEEIHFPPFRAALMAGARSLMTAYNSVDGSPATQSAALLNGVLREDWGFRGFVISDQSAVGGATVLHHTEASTATATKHAVESGLDVIFQSSYDQHRSYLEAFRRGAVDARAIDSAVARVLRIKFELGLFESPFAAVTTPAALTTQRAEHRALAREAARASLVLLRNEGNALPFGANVRRVAVIGPAADTVRLGGYTMDAAPGVSVAQGLRERLGDANVRVARTRAPSTTLVPTGVSGNPSVVAPVPADAFERLRGEYFANITLDGAAAAVRDESAIDFRWTLNAPARGLAFDWYSARFTGRVRVPPGGARRIGVEGNDGYRLWIDGRLVIDNWRKEGFGRRMTQAMLEPGTMHDLRLEFFESTGNARLRLVWDSEDSDSSDVARAVAAARASDAVVFVATVEEGEFRDRAYLSLPGNQEELITRVAAAGKPVVVVVLAGSAVTMMRWIDRVGAVVFAWYPGEEGGRAITDVLFGDVSPAGRLPVTFPVAEGQLPLVYNHKPTGRGDDYVDLTGMPAFPFGHGLSYSSFEYSALRVEQLRDTVAVRFRVKNTGSRAADEVAQVYVRDVLASVARPVMSLAGFARVRLAPGEARDLRVAIPARQLRFLDAGMRWVLEPGVLRVMIGASSEDIRLRGEVTLTPGAP